MDDLIHRDGLKQTLLDLGFYPAIVKSALGKAPTIDAVEVVRCKDCKNWNRHICTFDSPNGYCDAHEEMTNGYDFCSYGERKEGAN